MYCCACFRGAKAPLPPAEAGGLIRKTKTTARAKDKNNSKSKRQKQQQEQKTKQQQKQEQILRSFDCATRGKAVSGYAQDDGKSELLNDAAF
jgi:hypothetical protein